MQRERDRAPVHAHHCQDGTNDSNLKSEQALDHALFVALQDPSQAHLICAVQHSSCNMQMK